LGIRFCAIADPIARKGIASPADTAAKESAFTSDHATE
jgi:hypothetical protein